MPTLFPRRSSQDCVKLRASLTQPTEHLLDIKERIQSVLKAEAEAISAININDDYVSAVEVMMSCKGKILTTGIGKAGHIAKKFAATLCSTATPADFIHPAEAAHGDLGHAASERGPVVAEIHLNRDENVDHEHDWGRKRPADERKRRENGHAAGFDVARRALGRRRL